MSNEYLYAAVDEDRLNELASGKPMVGPSVGFSSHNFNQKLSAGMTGVVWEDNNLSEPVKPLLLITRPEDQRRLFGRFATLRSDLSPLSTWCHVLQPRYVPLLDGLSRRPTLNGFEAAWTGLAIAEALLLSDLPVSKLRLSACQATQTFAVSRAQALWGRSSYQECSIRFELAQRLFRTSLSTARRPKEYLEPVWAALSAASDNSNTKTSELRPITAALIELSNARNLKISAEIDRFIEPLLNSLPEAHALAELPEMRPEQRLNFFDALMQYLEKEDLSKPITARSTGLAMLAGYVATVAAGGAPSISLAENARRPDVMLWAYTLGGIGERVTWTSGFDGLGRMVARELMRTYRTSDQPVIDLSLDEAEILIDPQLSDPFVRLKIKQSRVVTIELLPGVNVMLSIGESPVSESRRQSAEQHARRNAPQRTSTRNEADLMAKLAESLWPHFRELVEDLIAHEDAKPGRAKAKRKDEDFRVQRKLIEP